MDRIQIAAKPERNYGIDLLRLVTMLFICILHVCNKGGIVSRLSLETAPDHYRIAWFFEALTFGSVNIFSMISGYVGYNKKFKLSRPLSIWLELVFYTVIGTVLISRFCPQIMPENGWLRAVMPVFNGEYWYMTAYFGMVILSPLINAAVQKMSTRSLGLTLLGIFVFFSTIPAVMNVSVFGLSSGYSTVWLCIMYAAGGFLAKVKKPHPLPSFFVFLLCTVLTWLFKINGVSRMLNYTSPTVVLAAAALTVTFAQINIRTKAGKAIIGFAAPSALGIFIIHVHTFSWDYLLKDAAASFVRDNAAMMTLKILAMAALIFIGCFAVDVIRRGIFWLLHIKPLLNRMDRAIDSILNKKTPPEPDGGEKSE
ncbi:MAG: acyltransferase [Clostridia bacterium]|nr:acyltransferase [Clostridia bacterium]